MPDGPDQQDDAAQTPDEQPAPVPSYHALDDLPEGAAQVELINDDDLAWVDKPELTEEERERRRARREVHKKKARRKRLLRRSLKIAGSLFATFLVLGGIWFWWTFGGLERMPSSAGQTGADTLGTNFLLIGDNPSEPNAAQVAGTGWQHAFRASDMVMVLHLTADARSMYVISIPGTSVLPIPGHGIGRLSDAFADGGQDLYLKTVETYVGAAMDHVVVLGMNGLREITDELGGVTMNVPQAACDVPAGPRRFAGDQVLEYTALYPCMPGRDLDRVQRQQSLLRALMRSAVDGGRIFNPFTVSQLLKESAGHLTVEDDYSYWDMFTTVLSMRNLSSTNTTFLTVPVAANPYTQFEGTDAIILDQAKDATLWQALRQDAISEYLALNTDATVLQ